MWFEDGRCVAGLRRRAGVLFDRESDFVDWRRFSCGALSTMRIGCKSAPAKIDEKSHCQQQIRFRTTLLFV
jgi:hypothetical protein